jgi:hypothetical protein
MTRRAGAISAAIGEYSRHSVAARGLHDALANRRIHVMLRSVELDERNLGQVDSAIKQS